MSHSSNLQFMSRAKIAICSYSCKGAQKNSNRQGNSSNLIRVKGTPELASPQVIASDHCPGVIVANLSQHKTLPPSPAIMRKDRGDFYRKNILGLHNTCNVKKDQKYEKQACEIEKKGDKRLYLNRLLDSIPAPN